MLGRKGLPVKVFSQRIRIPESYVGGSTRSKISSIDTVAKWRTKALDTIERRMERYCVANNVELVERTYIDGLAVHNGQVCLRQMVVCQVKRKLVLIQN